MEIAGGRSAVARISVSPDLQPKKETAPRAAQETEGDRGPV